MKAFLKDICLILHLVN